MKNQNFLASWLQNGKKAMKKAAFVEKAAIVRGM